MAFAQMRHAHYQAYGAWPSCGGEWQESWSPMKSPFPGTGAPWVPPHLDTDAETADPGHSDCESAASEGAGSKLSADTPAFTPLSQSRLSADTPAFTPEAGSRLAPATGGWVASELTVIQAAVAPEVVAPPPGLDVECPPGLEPRSAPPAEVEAVAQSRQAMLEHALKEGLPLKVRPPLGCPAMPQRPFDRSLPIKKGLCFPECSHLTEAVLRRLQPGEPAKKRPNEEFLLDLPPRPVGPR